MADVFISYAHADREWIERLAHALEADGLSVWWDRHVEAGADFTDDIERELHAAKAVIVAWSAAGAASRWVRDEASLAQASGKLIPIRLDGTPPPLGFRQFQAFDFSHWRGDADTEELRTLRASIARRIGPGPARPIDPPAVSGASPRFAGRRNRVAAAAGAGLVVALAMFAALLYLPAREPHPPTVGLAVIPFANLSSDPEQEHFVDGLTEELLNWLGNVEGLSVPGRTSSFQFKGRSEDLRAIGRALGVDYLLEGSVRRSGDSLRITAQLIEAKSGYHVWSETYDRSLADIFAIQDEIARIVVTELLGEIPESGVANPAAVGDVDPHAHELYLEGRALWAVRQAERAFEKFRAAADADPGHALAQAYVAVVGAYASGNGLPLPAAGAELDAIVDQALAAAVKARPRSSDVLFAQGWVTEFRDSRDRDSLANPAAISLYEQAVRANPRHVEALHGLSRRDLPLPQAIEYLERVLAIDPGLMAARTNLAFAYYQNGDAERARSLVRETLTLLPTSPRIQSGQVGKLLGDLPLFGEAIFADWDATERDVLSRLVRAALLADLGAVEEAQFLFAREHESGPLFLVARANTATLSGDVEQQLEAAAGVYATEPRPDWAAWMLALSLIAAGEPERAWTTLVLQRPDLATTPEVIGTALGVGDAEVLTAAHALARLGRRDEARVLWNAVLAAVEAAPVPSWRDSLDLALVRAVLGDRASAVAGFKAAYDAGFRYPWSYYCDVCTHDGFHAEHGLFAELVQIPEIGVVVATIEAENAQALAEFNRQYGVLDRVRAMMAAEAASASDLADGNR